MGYDKVFTDNDGEEFPYSESINKNGYYYRVSVIFDGKDGELNILKAGSHIEFDDGSWLDFNVAPKDLFSNKDKLSQGSGSFKNP
jgi:hypothetical protein